MIDKPSTRTSWTPKGASSIRVESLADGSLRLVPKVKKFNEVIVFVHHFGGHKASQRLQQQWLCQNGYEIISFDLKSPKNLFRKNPRHLWSEQIDEILFKTPGKKILYSFSMPSVAALESIAKRNALDVAGWISDGGPFVNGFQSSNNYLRLISKVKSPLTRWPLAIVMSQFLRGMGFIENVRSDFARLPKGFPILSIRCWQDKLVPIEAIEAFFSLAPSHVDLQVLSLAKSDHLQGFKREHEDYVNRVQKFLQPISTPFDQSSQH